VATNDDDEEDDDMMMIDDDMMMMMCRDRRCDRRATQPEGRRSHRGGAAETAGLPGHDCSVARLLSGHIIIIIIIIIICKRSSSVATA